MPTLAAVRTRVQVKLNDTDARTSTFDSVGYDHAIADAYISLGAQLPPPHIYIPSAFTIAANQDRFSLPTTVPTSYTSGSQYAGDIRIRLTSRNYFMRKVTVEELDSYRQYRSSTLVTSAWPIVFSLWQEMNDTVQGRSWPPAGTAEVCDLYVSLMPDDLRDAASLDAANVYLSRYGSTALVYYAAALLAQRMTAEDFKLRRLNPAAAQGWMKEAQTLLYKEAVKHNQQESTGRLERWIY